MDWKLKFCLCCSFYNEINMCVYVKVIIIIWSAVV